VLIIAFSSQRADAADAMIGTAGTSFTPADVTIEVGDTVTWIDLQSFGGHNVAQSASGVANTYDGSGFRSGDQGDFDTFEHTFNAPGVYYFICEPHVAFDMRGTVTVEGVALPAASPLGLVLSMTAIAAAAILLRYRYSKGFAPKA